MFLIFTNKCSSKNKTNCRPISLLTIISKILKLLPKDQINMYFEINNVFLKVSLVFVIKNQPLWLLISSQSLLLRVLRAGLTHMHPFLILSKHLISFLSVFSIESSVTITLIYLLLPSLILIWVRAQCVFFNIISSDGNPVQHGVVQGSVLDDCYFSCFNFNLFELPKSK